MSGDEIRPHDAIAIEENDVVAARGQNGAVADFTGPEAAVLVPYVFDAVPDGRLETVDQRSRRRARAIVGDQHLKVGIALTRERAQHRGERVLAVVGRDDDGNQLGHEYSFKSVASRRAG